MIRPFQADDFEAYQNMSRDFYNSEATDHQIPESHYRRTFDAIISASPLARGWIIFEADRPGEPVGYLLASLTWSNEFGGRVGWLEEVFIKEAFRGRGLGRPAIEAVMEELKNREEVRGFRLEVAPANAAVAELYRRLGFSPVPYDQWWLEV